MACAALSELGAALSWSPYSEDAQSEAIGLSDEFRVHLQRSFEQKMGGRTADASKFAKGCVAFLSESAAWTRWRSPCSSDFAQLLNDQEAALRADRARLELQRAAEVGSGPAATVTAANRTVSSQCAPRCAHITLTFALALHGMARMLHSVRFALLQVCLCIAASTGAYVGAGLQKRMSTFSEADPANNMETDSCANLWQLNAHCRRPIHAKLLAARL